MTVAELELLAIGLSRLIWTSYFINLAFLYCKHIWDRSFSTEKRTAE